MSTTKSLGSLILGAGMNFGIKNLGHSCELFHDGSPYYTETSSWICTANQWTGIYMIGASIKKKLISFYWKTSIIVAMPLTNSWKYVIIFLIYLHHARKNSYAETISQPAFTCSKSTIETLEQRVKYAQS